MAENETKSIVNWGLVCHVSGLAGYAIPFANIIAPLVIWLVRRDSDPLVKEAGREALNFNLSFTLYGLIAGLLCYVLIGFIVLPVILITHVVLIIQAILKSNKGQSVRYPLTLRFIN